MSACGTWLDWRVFQILEEKCRLHFSHNLGRRRAGGGGRGNQFSLIFFAQVHFIPVEKKSFTLHFSCRRLFDIDQEVLVAAKCIVTNHYRLDENMRLYCTAPFDSELNKNKRWCTSEWMRVSKYVSVSSIWKKIVRNRQNYLFTSFLKNFA